MRTTKTEEDERGGRKPTPVLYHGGKFDDLSTCCKPFYGFDLIMVISLNNKVDINLVNY